MIDPCPAFDLETGRIAYRDTGGPGLPVLFIHGIGGSKEVFEHQLNSPLKDVFRLIAFDLPGHGASEDADDPAKSYTIRALTDTAIDLMDRLRLPRALVVGWSLGGHIAFEMMDRFPDRLAGVMAIGAPPIAQGMVAVLRAFHIHADMLLGRKEQFTTKDSERWQRLCYGDNPDGMHFAAIVRTDGRMRPHITKSLLKNGVSDQRALVASSPVPLAIVNGSNDPIVRPSYFDTIAYANLWEDHPHLIPGAGHAPFLSHPNSVNMILHRFATDMARKFEPSLPTAETAPTPERAASPRSHRLAAG